MSRLEIIYTCALNCVKLLKRTGNETMILKEMMLFPEKYDVNQIIYLFSLLNEQAKADGTANNKADIKSSNLQNSNDRNATYRKKA